MSLLTAVQYIKKTKSNKVHYSHLQALQITTQTHSMQLDEGSSAVWPQIQ